MFSRERHCFQSFPTSPIFFISLVCPSQFNFIFATQHCLRASSDELNSFTLRGNQIMSNIYFCVRTGVDPRACLSPIGAGYKSQSEFFMDQVRIVIKQKENRISQSRVEFPCFPLCSSFPCHLHTVYFEKPP